MDRTRLESYFKDPETVDVAEMYDRFGLGISLQTRAPCKQTMRARANFLQEELDELKAAIEENDLLAQIDALVDLVVVAKGTAAQMGLRWKYHWNEVHRANMLKQPGSVPKRPDMPVDLIKPPGWCGPDHLRVMRDTWRSG